MAVVATLVPDKDGKRRRKWLLFVTPGIDWKPKTVYRRYRRRFGIESSYRMLRQMCNQNDFSECRIVLLLVRLRLTYAQPLGFPALVCCSIVRTRPALYRSREIQIPSLNLHVAAYH